MGLGLYPKPLILYFPLYAPPVLVQILQLVVLPPSFVFVAQILDLAPFCSHSHIPQQHPRL